MSFLWGKKSNPIPPTKCPSCLSTDVVETERTASEILFQCVHCWWAFVLPGTR
jgi:hypothetical protein